VVSAIWEDRAKPNGLGRWGTAFLVGLASLWWAENLPAAVIQTYSSQASFLAGLAPNSVAFDNGFSDLIGLGAGELSGNSRPYSGNGYSYTASTASTSLFVAGTEAEPWLTTASWNTPLVFGGISSAVPLKAVGGTFFLSDEAGEWAAGSVSLQATFVGGGSFSQTLSPLGPTAFFGFVADEAVSQFSIGSGTSDRYPTAGHVIVGVPEPSTAICLATGAILIAAWSAGRRRAGPRLVRSRVNSR
jgi:hypothetical protein